MSSSTTTTSTTTQEKSSRSTPTLMAAVRKQNLEVIKQLLPTASTKHIDHSFLIIVRDSDTVENSNSTTLLIFKQLLKHPNLSVSGLKSGLESAIMNRQREMLKLILKDRRIDVNYIADLLLESFKD
jgi:ankyrin repeat protein